MPGKLGEWIKREDGTTAIEFSLLMIPYIIISLAIIELSIMYAGASLLEGATGAAGRMVKTGQIQQSGGDPEAMFRQALCDYATVLISCEDIDLEIVPLQSYADYTDARFDADGNFVSQGVNMAGSNERVLIRVAYNYHVMSPFVGPLLAGPDSMHLFLSTLVLQTEPYDFGGL